MPYATMDTDTFTALIHEQEARKLDYTAPTAALNFETNPETKVSTMRIQTSDGLTPPVAVRENVHRQIATAHKVSWDYYQRMRDLQPALLDRNVNSWFLYESDTRNRAAQNGRPMYRFLRLLRAKTVGGEVVDEAMIRAYLSDSFQPLDDFDMMEEAVGPAFNKFAAAGRPLEVYSCDITPERFYLKAGTPKNAGYLTGEIPGRRGDIMRMALLVENNAVGNGKVAIKPLFYRDACDNSLIRSISDAYGIERVHRGARIGQGNDGREYVTSETKKLELRAFWSGVRDILEGTFTEEVFQRFLTDAGDAATRPLTDPTHAVEQLVKAYAITEGDSKLVYESLLTEGDMTQWGLVNAVTRAAHFADSYDAAIELEKIGGKLLGVTQREWGLIARKS